LDEWVSGVLFWVDYGYPLLRAPTFGHCTYMERRFFDTQNQESRFQVEIEDAKFLASLVFQFPEIQQTLARLALFGRGWGVPTLECGMMDRTTSFLWLLCR